jgi:hypothetical protein
MSRTDVVVHANGRVVDRTAGRLLKCKPFGIEIAGDFRENAVALLVELRMSARSLATVGSGVA